MKVGCLPVRGAALADHVYPTARLIMALKLLTRSTRILLVPSKAIRTSKPRYEAGENTVEKG
jgi:hypothetical protein